MAKDRTARPVSGEIMADRAASSERFVRVATDDIVDADFEVLPRSGVGHETAPPPSRATAMPAIEGMDMLRKPEAASSRLPAARGGPIFWIAGIGAALAAFWTSGGHALVRRAPFLVAGYQVAGQEAALSISGVISRVDASGRKPVLFVDGEAVNDGTGPSQLPPLEISVTDNDSQIIRYRLGTSDHLLAPGERFGFASRLDVPRNGVRAVSVTFAD
jgi:hypothetical protein